jgi:hypothetical protein
MTHKIVSNGWIRAFQSYIKSIPDELHSVFTKRTVVLLLFLSLSLVVFVLFYASIQIVDKGTPVVIAEKERLILFLAKNPETLTQKNISARMGMTDIEKARLILSELKRWKVVPDVLSLQDFAIGEEGVIYLNLSGTLAMGSLGPLRELSMIYGIVNSFLANFSETKRVQILFEGRPSVTINGLLYTQVPLAFNKDIVED